MENDVEKNRAGKRDINDPANMHVSEFCASEAEFLASESVRMNGYVWPRAQNLFELVQVFHHPKLR